MMYQLNHDLQTVKFDEQARLLAYGQQNCIADVVPWGFKLILDDGCCKECVAFSNKQAVPTITATADTIVYDYPVIAAFNGRETVVHDIQLTLSVRLDGEKVVYSAVIDNRSTARILEFWFPIVGRIRSLGKGFPALLMPAQSGMRYQAIGPMLGRQPDHRENGHNSMSTMYPGSASMQWMALTDDVHTLFLTGHDSEFFPTELLVKGEAGKDTVSLIFCRNVCLAGGHRLVVADTILHGYDGDWHRGAADYAAWMSQYRPAHRRPDWVRDMKGYFLVINKQQYGYEMWPYEKLPELYRLAQAHGCDTVGLFGWYQSGHDNQYPDLEVSSTMGGEEALKAGIKAIQAAGGHVTLYYQGHLIDETSQFFREGPGKALCSKNIWGNPYVEFYPKNHESDFMRQFSRKMFAISCPSQPAWQEMMLKRQDWLAGLGPDGCLYDQIGGCPPYPCFDPTHHHKDDNPALANPAGRREMLNSLQNHSKEIGPDFAFFSEHIVDMNSAYLDMAHGILSYPGGQGAYAAAAAAPNEVRQLNYPALFRFCFPETKITIRNPAPTIEPRAANYALVYGFIPEMEIRYQADCDDVRADYRQTAREYLRKTIALTDRYGKLLRRGCFRDTIEFTSVNPAVTASCFVSEDGTQLACVFWNDSAQEQSLAAFELHDGWTFTEAAGPDGALPSLPTVLSSGELCIGVYAWKG